MRYTGPVGHAACEAVTAVPRRLAAPRTPAGRRPRGGGVLRRGQHPRCANHTCLDPARSASSMCVAHTGVSSVACTLAASLWHVDGTGATAERPRHAVPRRPRAPRCPVPPCARGKHSFKARCGACVPCKTRHRPTVTTQRAQPPPSCGLGLVREAGGALSSADPLPSHGVECRAKRPRFWHPHFATDHEQNQASWPSFWLLSAGQETRGYPCRR